MRRMQWPCIRNFSLNTNLRKYQIECNSERELMCYSIHLHISAYDPRDLGKVNIDKMASGHMMNIFNLKSYSSVDLSNVIGRRHDDPQVLWHVCAPGSPHCPAPRRRNRLKLLKIYKKNQLLCNEDNQNILGTWHRLQRICIFTFPRGRFHVNLSVKFVNRLFHFEAS